MRREHRGRGREPHGRDRLVPEPRAYRAAEQQPDAVAHQERGVQQAEQLRREVQVALEIALDRDVGFPRRVERRARHVRDEHHSVLPRAGWRGRGASDDHRRRSRRRPRADARSRTPPRPLRRASTKHAADVVYASEKQIGSSPRPDLKRPARFPRHARAGRRRRRLPNARVQNPARSRRVLAAPRAVGARRAFDKAEAVSFQPNTLFYIMR